MVGEDEVEFINFVYNQGDNIIDRFDKVMTKEEVTKEKFGQVYIKLPQSIIKMTTYGQIDDFNSNVIEYDRSEIKGKRISAGRIFLDPQGAAGARRHLLAGGEDRRYARHSA